MAILATMVLLLLVALGTIPTWPYSRRWTFYPSGACGGIVLIMVALILWGNL